MEDILADLGANARSEQAIREELREKIGESAGTLYNSASSVAEGDVFGIAADSEVVQSLTLVGDSSDPVEEGNEIDEALANVLRREAEIVNDRLARRRNKLNHINNSISIDSSSLIANTGVVIKEEPYTTVDSNISETAVSGNGTTTVSPPSDIAADRDDGRLAKTNQSIKKSASRVSRINGRQNKQSKVIAEETSRLDASGLTCPICNESFPYADKVNPEVLMSRHVDRCMRRQATEVSTSRKRSRSEPSSRFASEEILRQFDSDASDEESKESVELLDPKDVYKANSSREDQSDDSDEAGEQELMDSDDENVLRTTRNSTAATVSRRRKSNHVHRNRESHSIELNDSDSDRPPVLIEIGDIKDDWEDQDYLARIDPYLEASRTVVELTTDDGLVVDQECWESLYDYQREGCIWLHNLYQDGLGGILGDEMGLGKTAQLCVHFSNLAKGIRSDPYQKKSAALLIVCPATVMNHWLREMNRWAPEMRTVIVHKISMIGGELSRMGDATLGVAIERLQRSRNTRGLTVITTYEGLRKHRGVLGLLEWTAVCLDEGQKIRNPETEITAVCKSIPAYHRVILSGTPIQNNLKELWSLFDFIYPGRLGSLQIFDTEFASPIRMGGYSNASKLQSEIAVRSAAVLQRIVRPYLLRRKKEDLISVTKLPPKTEQVLFCRISPKQRAMYLEVLDSPEIQQVLMRKLTAFRAINVLRKLCNHPALIENDGKVVWHSDYNRDRNIDDDDRDEEAIVRDNLGRISWADSGKMLVLSKVLPLWYSEGHKVLLFTQTRVMLDLVESMIRELGFKHLRLDGNTPIHKRAGIIERFNKDPSIFIILLTSRTGGVGVSLTAANRVVLYDPDWNPMTDVQSRERAWRIGQSREVTIYRLITRGTVEEKIYQRQIFKLLLSNRILDNPKQKALFSKSDLRELFQLTDESGSMIKSDDTELPAELPAGGEVDLTQTGGIEIDNGHPGISPSQQTLYSNREKRDQLPTDEKKRVEVEDALDVEDYIEQNIPSDLLQNSSHKNGDSSELRDRQLLKALFDGEAITSVYDHEHVDPESKNFGNTDRLITASASNIVNRAVQQLESSAPVYQARMRRDESILPSPAKDENGQRQRFGQVSKTGDSSTSSFSLLNAIKATQNIHLNTDEASTSAAPSSRAIAARSAASSSKSTAVATENSQSNPPRRVGIRQDIIDRLTTLFRRPYADGLSTQYLVGQFRDLGDHYAPLFKETLRSIAYLRDGKWYSRT